MDDETAQLNLLLDLETRHEDLLQRLDELDRRVQQVLKEYQPSRNGGMVLENEPVVG